VRKYVNYSGLKNALGTYNSELRQKYLDRLVRGFANRGLSWDTLDAGRGNNKADDMIRSTPSVSKLPKPY
jgi:hypothetical protein